KANAIRNANPEIARGELKILDEYYDQSKYVCVMQRTWDGSTVTIAVNLDREWEHDIKLDGEFKLSDSLCANSGDTVSLKGSTLHLPAYSIAILK
ncbi:MAG: hypothetical protein IK091_00785, partial [Spirochaetales bacterium]|nr:hypothetical protein [Spirochaetales bacterium]